MNYILKYYYDIDALSIVMNQNTLHIKTLSDSYIMKTINNVNVIDEIVKIIAEQNLYSEFNEIVETKEGRSYVTIRNQNYILIRNKNLNSRNIPLKKITPIDAKKFKNINVSNWYFLWANKNDGIRDIVRIHKKDILQEEQFYYYLGIAENAILYLKVTGKKEKNNCLSISRRRISNDMIDDPTNIVLDCRERDVAEVIKYIYFNLNNFSSQLDNLIELSLKEQLSFEIIFARILYPTHYFDYIEKKQKHESHMTSKFVKYEEFLKYVYNKFSEKKKIKKIDWL